jgi:hypothetical protein
MNFNKTGKVFTSTFVGTGPSSYKKITYWAAVSERLRTTGLDNGILNISQPYRPPGLLQGFFYSIKLTSHDSILFPSLMDSFVLEY